ncbi:MAG: RNase adapter RapZ [Casimicrobiaceae bacterium]|nr:RNase adapter RapZ [Casimicrobiaceae bacterium]MDW8311178.1 RNase adapter RapZ [Burkholderiales bacterium]
MNASAPEPLIVLVVGVSGAGKNVAVGALEDLGCAVINNLPAALLEAAVEKLRASRTQPIAISVNAQDAHFGEVFAAAYARLRARYGERALVLVRLDARDEVLVARFVETRRRHPFADDQHTLLEAIRDERERLRAIEGRVVDIDTSGSSAHALRQRIRALFAALEARSLRPLVAVSTFAYRGGLPQDADLVFDARVLPNPYYEPELRALTGRDAAVVAFLDRQPEARALIEAIVAYLRAQMPGFLADNRVRVHVAIGCTGGQHRSIYVADRVAAALAADFPVSRHDREHPPSGAVR